MQANAAAGQGNPNGIAGANARQATQAGAANGFTMGGEAAAGNAQLGQAFDTAIQAAQETLQITTEKGAALYAIKQRVG